jgi:hypothetical protein
MSGVIGIQICNEADSNAPGMYKAYDEIQAIISDIDGSIPLYISDGWDLREAVRYVGRKNSVASGNRCPLVIDRHMYWCFSPSDKDKRPQDIIDSVPANLAELDCARGSVVDQGAVEVVVGEYSCVMAEESWAKVNILDGRSALAKEFGEAQSLTYQQYTGGCFFWTLKMVSRNFITSYSS